MIRENEDFLTLCREFESLVRTSYGLKDSDSPYYYLAGREDFEQYRDSLNMIRSLRNLLVHNKTEYDKAPALVVGDAAGDVLNQIMNKVENPLLAKDVMTRNVIKGTPENTVGQMLDTMKQAKVARIPIEQDGRLVGVFSENAVFRRLVSGTELKRERTIKDWLTLIHLDHPDGERYLLVPENEPVWKLEEKFFEKNRRPLAAAFVMNKERHITGIITVYDLAREEAEEN